MDSSLNGLLLHFGLLLLGLLVLDELLGFFLIGLLQLQLLLLAAENGHLPVLSNLLELLLLVGLLGLKLSLLLLLEGMVLVTDLLRLAVHDVALVRNHFISRVFLN